MMKSGIEMLRWVADYIATYNRPPAQNEISQAMGIGRGSVNHTLNSLALQGYIKKSSAIRSIAITERGHNALSNAPAVTEEAYSVRVRDGEPFVVSIDGASSRERGAVCAALVKSGYAVTKFKRERNTP